MGCFSILLTPSAGASFFFSAWIIMVFWGIMADDIGVNTISYPGAMVVTIALWMTVAPLIAALGRSAFRRRI